MLTRLIVALIVLCVHGVLEADALAEGIVAERLSPANTPGGYISTERPETAGHLNVRGTWLTNFAGSSLRVVSGSFSSSLIDYTFGGYASVSLGLLRFMEVGIALPVTLYQQGAGINSPVGVGDLRIYLKGRLLTGRYGGLGLFGTFYVPTGDRHAFSGMGQVAFAPRLLSEVRLRRVRLALNAGVLLRQRGHEQDFEVSHELLYSVGMGLRAHRRLEFLLDLYGSTELAAPFADSRHSPTEIAGALALRLGSLELLPGAAAGIVNGFGTPAWRVFVGLSYHFGKRPLLSQPAPMAQQAAALPPPLRPLELAPPEEALEPPSVYRGNAEVVVTDTELIPIKAIFFELNRARVQHGFYGALDALATILKEHPELGMIQIEGHTDISGTAAFNRQLSQRRAQAVREALIKRGVPALRLEALGYGATRPMEDNKDETGRAKNRRVVFYHAGLKSQTAAKDGAM